MTVKPVLAKTTREPPTLLRKDLNYTPETLNHNKYTSSEKLSNCSVVSSQAVILPN